MFTHYFYQQQLMIELVARLHLPEGLGHLAGWAYIIQVPHRIIQIHYFLMQELFPLPLLGKKKQQ
ncbi:MAG: hypothetical protein EBR82_53555 [Caulobacteraceae bacterium]|nr:hypothetical protein [Caulobacteraceae bacterium]